MATPPLLCLLFQGLVMLLSAHTSCDVTSFVSHGVFFCTERSFVRLSPVALVWVFFAAVQFMTLRASSVCCVSCCLRLRPYLTKWK